MWSTACTRSRLAPVLQVAIARFAQDRALRAQLDEAQAQLSERKQIERAKGILMARLRCSEEQAYSQLRKLAMDRGSAGPWRNESSRPANCCRRRLIPAASRQERAPIAAPHQNGAAALLGELVSVACGARAGLCESQTALNGWHDSCIRLVPKPRHNGVLRVCS